MIPVYNAGMRRVLFLALAGLVLICSCESKNPVEQYGDDVTGAYKSTERFVGQINLQSLQEAVRSFHAMNGRYPNDLSELEHFVGTALDPARYDYNPSTGTITAKK